MKRFIQHRRFEVLEAKRMNAANLIGSAMAAVPATSDAAQASVSGSAAGASANAGAGAAAQTAAGATHLSANLSGTGQGTVNLVSKSVNGNGHANFVLHVSGAPANQPLDVSIGGNVVGSISTDAAGNGLLHLNSALHNADDLLNALGNLGANANISVGVSGQTPILTGTLQAAANLGLDTSGITSTVSGVVHAASNLENAVISKVNSIVNNLDSHAGSAVNSLLSVTDKLDNVANRLVGKADNLTAAVVDKVFGNPEVSNLLGIVDSLVPVDLTGVV
jgi:hypothetical protein